MYRNFWQRYLVIANENESNFGCHKLKRLIPICYLFILCLFNKQDRQVWDQGDWGEEEYIDFYYFILHHLQFHLQQEQLLYNLHTKKGTKGYFSECCKQLNWNIVNLSHGF